MNKVSEIQITPIKPNNGLVAFASFVLNNDLFLGSIAIMTKAKGGYRLVYPTKKIGNVNINLFHPISKAFAEEIDGAVIKVLEDVMSISNVGYSSSSIG
jgi:DNA-binding cell septation regulator SpoVG